MSHLYDFADIEDLPPAVQEKLYDEVLDRDVQKGMRVLFMLTSLHYSLSLVKLKHL